MWLNRNIKLMESFPPQKWDVNAYSMWSGYSVFGFTDSQPWYQAKEVWITHHHSHPQHSTCELLHMHSFLPETDWCNIHDLPNYLYKNIYLYKSIYIKAFYEEMSELFTLMPDFSFRVKCSLKMRMEIWNEHFARKLTNQQQQS